jgi:hypothetical protein
MCDHQALGKAQKLGSPKCNTPIITILLNFTKVSCIKATYTLSAAGLVSPLLPSTAKIRDVSQITSAKGQRNLRNLMMQGKSKFHLEIFQAAFTQSERNYKARKKFKKFLRNPYFCPQTVAIRKKIGSCWFKFFKISRIFGKFVRPWPTR